MPKKKPHGGGGNGRVCPPHTWFIQRVTEDKTTVYTFYKCSVCGTGKVETRKK